VTIRVQGLDHVAFAVGDQERSLEWYRELLGLEREFADVWGDTPAAAMSGGSGLALFKTSGERPHGFRHIAFRVDRENFDRARRELPEKGIELEFQDHDVSHSIYFTDPDGVQVELTTYDV
jgi:catechol 2,3-dioxygenase-like lactoylglutathione lyase family enzyme